MTEKAKQKEEHGRSGAGAGRHDADGMLRVPGLGGAGAKQEGSPGGTHTCTGEEQHSNFPGKLCTIGLFFFLLHLLHQATGPRYMY